MTDDSLEAEEQRLWDRLAEAELPEDFATATGDFINEVKGLIQDERIKAKREVLEAIAISPSAKMALTVANSQLERGENPTPNVTAVLVLELNRMLAELDTPKASNE